MSKSPKPKSPRSESLKFILRQDARTQLGKWFRKYTDSLSTEFFCIIASCIFKMFVFGSQNVHDHKFFKKVVQSEFFSYKERYPISFTNCHLEKDLVRVASGPMRNHPSTWILLWEVDYKMSAIWSHEKERTPECLLPCRRLFECCSENIEEFNPSATQEVLEQTLSRSRKESFKDDMKNK